MTDAALQCAAIGVYERNSLWNGIIDRVCAALEYLSSFILDIMFNLSYWDYKTEFLNLNGRICFAGLTAFAIGGMAAIYLVAPALADFAHKHSKKWQVTASALLCTAFAADIVCCLIFGFNSGAGVGGSI